MRTKRVMPRDVTPALEAIYQLFSDQFAGLTERASMEGSWAHAQIEHAPIAKKNITFFRHFIPLRKDVIALLTDTYRRFFKVALAQVSVAGFNPDEWAKMLLQPAVKVVLDWMVDWYILACDGENESVRYVGTMLYVPAHTATIQVPVVVPPFPPRNSWRAPAWLFGVSLAIFGIGRLKEEHVPNSESEEKLGTAHTLLIVKGARRLFLWELGSKVETARNEEVATAGTILVPAVKDQRKMPNKRKGWEQRLKLYRTIQRLLNTDPSLKGMAFCAELDKRHALPLFDWVKSGQWRNGLTWKEAWNVLALRRKIRRVRQEAQKAS